MKSNDQSVKIGELILEDLREIGWWWWLGFEQSERKKKLMKEIEELRERRAVKSWAMGIYRNRTFPFSQLAKLKYNR